MAKKGMVEFFTEKDFDRAHNSGWSCKQYAEFCNRLLTERSQVVECCADRGEWRHAGGWPSNREGVTGVTHTALLVAVQPIAKDTAESLLRDFLNWADRQANEFGLSNTKLDYLREEARKVLGAE